MNVWRAYYNKSYDSYTVYEELTSEQPDDSRDGNSFYEEFKTEECARAARP